MMECTDRNYRYLARLITKRTLLWTEMIVSDALVTHEANNETRDLERLLGYSREEHPLALQLGGSDPELLAKASALCVSRCHLEELNLNCGCPSERVGGKKLDESKQVMIITAVHSTKRTVPFGTPLEKRREFSVLYAHIRRRPHHTNPERPVSQTLKPAVWGAPDAQARDCEALCSCNGKGSRKCPRHSQVPPWNEPGVEP
jgi:hypothetical protein